MFYLHTFQLLPDKSQHNHRITLISCSLDCISLHHGHGHDDSWLEAALSARTAWKHGDLRGGRGQGGCGIINGEASSPSVCGAQA